MYSVLCVLWHLILFNWLLILHNSSLLCADAEAAKQRSTCSSLVTVKTIKRAKIQTHKWLVHDGISVLKFKLIMMAVAWSDQYYTFVMFHTFMDKVNVLTNQCHPFIKLRIWNENNKIWIPILLYESLMECLFIVKIVCISS